jgi:hypothetical protein
MLIQAKLDAFWSRASKTIANHVQEVRNMARYDQMFRYSPMPVLGPGPLYSHLGMDTALSCYDPWNWGRQGLRSSMGQPERHAPRLLCSGTSSGDDLTLSAGSVRGRFVATLCPSEGQWYQRFKTGIAAQMGDVVSQDRAYTIEVLLALLEMYEEEWQTFYLRMPLNSICACMFLLVSSLGGMRGFKVLWTDLAALRYDLAYCEAAEDETAVPWPIVGRFKAHHGVLDCYMIPIAGTTFSGIRFFNWTQRFVCRLALDGFEEGWAFRRTDGSRAKASDYQENIFCKLEIIQATTTLIDPGCSIWDEYGHSEVRTALLHHSVHQHESRQA